MFGFFSQKRSKRTNKRDSVLIILFEIIKNKANGGRWRQRPRRAEPVCVHQPELKRSLTVPSKDTVNKEIIVILILILLPGWSLFN